MDSENLFTVVAAIVITVVVSLVGGCEIYKVYSVNEMVEAGANPLVAKCAMNAVETIVCFEALKK